MPIKVPDNLPTIKDLNDENVDVMASKDARRQDIRPLKLLLLNLMPKKRETEIQFARLLGNSPLQIDLTLMTTRSYTPTHIEPGYLRRYYRDMNHVRDDCFDALIITGAPVERLAFEDVAYWKELKYIMDWSKESCFRRLGICWGAQALLAHLHGVTKHESDAKLFGIFEHNLLDVSNRVMRGFIDTFPMPVSRYTKTQHNELEEAGITVLAEGEECGVGLARDSEKGDLFVMNHLEYDAETLNREYKRDLDAGITTDLPKSYFPENNPDNTPVNFWQPFAYLLISNWINDLYQSTPFDLYRKETQKKRMGALELLMSDNAGNAPSQHQATWAVEVSEDRLYSQEKVG